MEFNYAIEPRLKPSSFYNFFVLERLERSSQMLVPLAQVDYFWAWANGRSDARQVVARHLREGMVLLE